MTQEFMNGFVAELTRAVGALLNTTATPIEARTAAAGDGFVVTIAAREGGRGELRVYFARAGAEALAKALGTDPLEPTEAKVVQCLKDLCGQAITAFDVSSSGTSLGVVLVALSPELPGASAGVLATSGAVHVEIAAKGLEPALQVMLAGDFEITASAAAPFEAATGGTLDVIMDLDLPLVVRFGRTELPLRMLTALGPGSVIDLGRAPDEPVDVLISNRVVARGEVVIVAGNYGVRVHDVVSPAERARSLEAEFA